MEKKEMKGGVFNECLLMNVFPAGCPHRQRGKRRGGGSAKCRQLQRGGDGRGSKITKNVLTFFMDGPYHCIDVKPKRYRKKPSFVLCCTIPRRSAFADCLDNTLLGIMIYTQGISQFLVVFSDVSSRSQKEILTSYGLILYFVNILCV